MKAQLLVGLSVVVVACTFPEVATDGADAGTTSTASSPTTTGTVDPTTTTTTSATASTGDGGAPSTTTTSSQGGGGAASGGGSTSDGGGGGSSGPGGDGTCDAGCDYTVTPEGAGGGDTDCDDDGDPNGPDCQPCDPAVFHRQGAFFGVQHLREDGTMSWDYDCSGEPEFDRLFDAQGCSGFGQQTCPDGDGEGTYVGNPTCGEPQPFTTCEIDFGLVGGLGECVSSGEQSNPTVLCH